MGARKAVEKVKRLLCKSKDLRADHRCPRESQHGSVHVQSHAEMGKAGPQSSASLDKTVSSW